MNTMNSGHALEGSAKVTFKEKRVSVYANMAQKSAPDNVQPQLQAQQIVSVISTPVILDAL